jgi:phosphate transport system permease protein
VLTAEHPEPEADAVTTTVVQPPPQRRRQLHRITPTHVQDIVGALVVGVCSTLLLFGGYAPFSGVVGFVIVSYVIFLAVYATLVGLRDDRAAVVNSIFTVLMSTAAIVTVGALAAVVLTTFWKGLEALVHLNFFTQDMSKAGPLDSLNRGGIAHGLVGTLWMIGIALVLTAPLGLLTAIYLSESRSRFARALRTVIDAMTAFPTILAGLFIYAFWILTLGQEKTGLAAALALSVMMLPYIIRGSDLVLRLIPGNLREASAALGAPRWRTVWHVVLPTARPGLAIAVILGVARGIGEASPVLLTAGFTTYFNANPLKGPMVSLPLVAFKLVGSGQEAFKARGFACASFLLILILALFVLARIVGGHQPGQMSERRRRRVQRASARAEARFAPPVASADAITVLSPESTP